MIKISNVYYMLAFCYKKLTIKDISKHQQEEFDNIYDLFATIMTGEIKKQIKRGLNREYINYKEETANIRGKININESIKKNTKRNNKLICEYDEYSIDSFMNRIIKTSGNYLLKSKKIKDKIIYNMLKKTLSYFNDIEEIVDLKSIRWSSLHYNKNNISYKFLMEICYLILTNLYIGKKDGKMEFNDFLEDKAMAALFENFIREYYRQNSKINNFILEKRGIPWDIDFDNSVGLLSKIPKMEDDITINDNYGTLIIDAKFYLEIYNKYYEREKFKSNCLYQMYSYVKNAKSKYNNVSGVLIYAKNDNIDIGWSRFDIGGNSFIITDLDLSKDFCFIEEKLNDIIYWHQNKLLDNDLIKKYNKE